MRLIELRGLPVIDPTAARKMGIVSDYQVDPATSRVAALDITGVENGEPERILGHRIRRVGRHAVILTGRASATPSVVPDLNDHWLDASSLVGLEVLGDDGTRIGHLIDGVFDQDTLEIQAYLLRASFWEQLIGRRGRIEPNRVHACSRELMIVSTGRATEAAPETEGAQPDGDPERAPVPLKQEDRLPSPVLQGARDGQTVGSHSE